MRHSLLMLCQTLPYPPNAGVSIRTYNVLRLLARRFDVTALCFFRAALHPTAESWRAARDALERFATVRVFPIPQEHNSARLAWDHFRSVVTGRPYTRYAYRSESFSTQLRQALEEQRFDLVHIDSLDLSDYVPVVNRTPIVCVHHNVESRLLERRASSSEAPVRGYLLLQARLLRREERQFCPHFSLNITVSDDDAAHLRHIAPGARTAVIPNGVDTTTFRPADEDGAGVVFVGGASWEPNRDGMIYFCEKVLPVLRERGHDPQVTWVGSASENLKHEFRTRYRVRLTGYVEDIRPFVTAASCYIVPLRAGGGTRLKILDAWAMGKAIVSTSQGCEGLNATDGVNILIRDTPERFATGVAQILENADLRRKLGESGRRIAEQEYDWEVIGKRMLPLYEQALRSGR